jgi:hypothetical protein
MMSYSEQGLLNNPAILIDQRKFAAIGMLSHRKENRFVGQIEFNPQNGHSGQQDLLGTLRRAARSVSDFDLPSRRFTQCAKVIVHRPRMTKNKTRHKPENGIVNLAVLRDPHDGIFSIGLE